MPKKQSRAHRILVVDDEPGVRSSLAEMLVALGYSAETVGTGRDALRVLRQSVFDVMITDVMLPDMSGLDLLTLVRDKYRWLPVIVITGFASVDSTVTAMRRGAVDYIPKPFTSDSVASAIQQALAVGAVREKPGDRQQAVITFRSAAMGDVMDLVRRVSRTDSTVLITGESGTGKELVARSIHDLSRRVAQPFISVNSGALPEGLLESELFGHVRGAFTGAVAANLGRFRLADGGSLFLDEVGNMSPSMQVKLLRVLQEKEITPVGGSDVIRVDVRLIAATNLNLEDAVRAGSFREDLFYRLNVIEIHLPPLRQRREDIIPLAEHFLSRIAARTGSESLKLGADAVALLMGHSWPGNVRELENAIEHASVMASGSVLRAEDFPVRLGGSTDIPPDLGGREGEAVDLQDLLERIERYYIISALKRAGGVRSRAAALLGMKRTTLLARMKSLGLVRGGAGL
ncbi:sigma-54-dependent Fis family transcriptional regulator [Candidatus Fermentibacteria bacterium]|nr:sigma-54-dependent Fis family transcriptional regulator [Candidatus Fermentibacteria bacterium]